jgi:hypothetical protein
MSCGAASFLSFRCPHFLGSNLVLQMHRGGPGILEAAHHVHDVERLAIAGVAIHQHRQAIGTNFKFSGPT